jgi:intracellular septation protein
MAAKASPILRMAIDYGVTVVFLVTWLVTGSAQKAAWVLAGASVLALAAGLLLERRIAPIPAFAGGSALVFAALSLVVRDPAALLKIKFTFVEGALAVFCFGGVALRRNPLKFLFRDAFALTDAAWRTLTIRYGAFFAACALTNEILRRTLDDHQWIYFKFAAMGAALLFSLAQTPFLMKHGAFADGPKPAEPPDPGF